MPVIESLLRIPEASKISGISVRKYYQLLASGRAPEVVRIGRAVRVRASDLDLWIKLGCPNREAFEAAKSSEGRTTRCA